MAHNPPRPQGLSSEATARIAEQVAHRPKPRWQNLGELCEWIRKRARAGMTVHLASDTAMIVASHLETAHAKPTRDEIALMICRHGEAQRCQEACYECRGKANIVMNAYGCRLDDRQATDAPSSGATRTSACAANTASKCPSI